MKEQLAMRARTTARMLDPIRHAAPDKALSVTW